VLTHRTLRDCGEFARQQCGDLGGTAQKAGLKDHLKVIEWTYWRGDKHKNGPWE